MPSRLLLETARFRVLEHHYSRRGQAITKQTIEHPGAVVVLPLLHEACRGGGRSPEPSGPRVLLIRNHRVAVGQTLIELPAGTLEPPEPPLAAARRELAEETGYTADRLLELPAFYMSPGILNERMHCFVAEGLSPGEARREPGEEIENLPTPLDRAIAMVRRGDIQDAKTIVALLYYRLLCCDV